MSQMMGSPNTGKKEKRSAIDIVIPRPGKPRSLQLYTYISGYRGYGVSSEKVR